MHAKPKLTAADVIRLLDLKPHPEGGHFRETIRDLHAEPGSRAHSTGIYFLLAAGERSAIWGEQRAQLLAGVPAGSRARELDSGHTIHRDRFGEYLAAVLAWIDAGR